MNKHILFALLLSVFATSEGCRRQQLTHTTSSTTPTTPPDTAKVVERQPPSPTTDAPTIPPAATGGNELARANVAEVDFRYLTTKSKLSFKSPKQEIDNANVTIRVRKDSLIWISVSKLGIEAVRAQITRDSIMIIDKIHREYAASDFSTLSRQFNFQMSFELLQALLVGNLPLPNAPAQKSKGENGNLLLRQSEGKLVVENYIGEQDRKLKKLTLSEPSTKNTLRMEYEDFTSLATYLFPYGSQATLDYQSKTDGQLNQTLLRIKHSKVELADQTPGFPFTIPASYQRRP
ncbi:hypothetical protein GCM10028807_19730 [Spirosoma daeguense]